MVDMRLRDRRMLAESYHPKRDYMNTSPTIGVLLAAGAILLPSCETERVNERPIGIYPTENVYPSGAMGAQGNSLLNDIQRENSLDPMAGQNSGFNPDPARTNSGTISNMVGGANNITPPAPVVPKPVVPNPVGDSAGSGIAAPRPVEPPASSSIPVAWPTADPTVVVSPYDRTKKIKILNRSTNKPYPSGTVLRDTNFPTVDPADPYQLTEAEEEVVEAIAASFQHGERLRRHVDYLVANGGMYKAYNGNLLFHGCIPMNADGSFAELDVEGKYYSGKALLDALDQRVRRAYYSGTDSDTDFYWYLWVGARSPLFGKEKVTTFERYFTEEPELRNEPKNAYYTLIEEQATAERILKEFGLNPATGHIINGHMPVKVGESPIKAGGRAFVIDGGIAKSYRPTTGIAGYTLIYNSTVIKLAEHKPILDESGRHVTTQTITRVVETMPHQIMMDETDTGRDYQEKIRHLEDLIALYRNGTLRQHSDN